MVRLPFSFTTVSLPTIAPGDSRDTTTVKRPHTESNHRRVGHTTAQLRADHPEFTFS
jgi:hypothetical protein